MKALLHTVDPYWGKFLNSLAASQYNFMARVVSSQAAVWADEDAFEAGCNIIVGASIHVNIMVPSS